MMEMIELTQEHLNFLADKIMLWLEADGVRFNSPIEIQWINEKFGLTTAGCAWDDPNDKLRTTEVAFRGHPRSNDGVIEDLEFSSDGGQTWSSYPTAAKLDFLVENHRTVWRFTPLTPNALEFAKQELGLEAWQWLGNSFHVEHRFAAQTVRALAEDGWLIGPPETVV